MLWWSWIVVGVLLFGAELFFVDAQFYLVFIGTAALIVGGLELGGMSLPNWQQWLMFAAFSLIAMFTFRQRLYYFLRPPTPDIPIGPAGDSVTVSVTLEPGASCRIEYRGSHWDARNDGEQTIVAGTQAKILRVDGLTLKVSGA
jgi:membrane protein implicated in regulation of membrane protease activity